MRRQDLEHIIGAAAHVVEEDEFTVVGSQAILGEFPDAPDPLLRSMEADIFPTRDPSKADRIDGALGDGSRFHETYGYYAHGVGPETAKAPAGWQERLVRLRVPPRPGSSSRPVAFCLEIHDLVLAKCAASRDRDWEFAQAALDAGLVDPDVLLGRVDDMPIEPSGREHLRAGLERTIRNTSVRSSS